ncbi:MAG: metal ABC transporter permease [Candidatus Theseobacter exili]|nr:metal ABC transporter permease [Candidatus Theseobacter exili]
MSEIARFFLIQILFLAVVLILHTYLGLHIIRRTLIFSDLVLDQLAAFGALVGISIGISYGSCGSYVISLIAVLLGAFLLAAVKPGNRLIPREAIIGIAYVLALVASLLLGDKLPGGSSYVTKTLVGSMLWVNWPIVLVTITVYVVLMVFHYVFREKIIGITERKAIVHNEVFWDFLFFTTQGIITVLVVPIAGVLLAYAFLMIPAAIAAMFTKKWGIAVVGGWGIGLVACILGLNLSFFYNLPYGPSLVLSLGVFFFVSVFIRALLPGK